MSAMQDSPAPGPRDFATTRWSLVVATDPNEANQARAREALEELCKAYWYPLYSFVRRRGYSSSDAQDLTQAFFARIIESGGLAGADPRLGRFRTYLLGAMKHFLANEWHRARTLKRGGGVTILQWDALAPEARYALEPVDTCDPEAGFDRQWAQESIARALEKLRIESEAHGKGELFDSLKASLAGSEFTGREVAARLGMTPGAVKVAMHRLRSQFRTLLRAGIAETVSDPSEIDEEMRYLLAALRGS
jgi:RNA polymerase sigma-70 factor (ECF subfamily)